MSFTDTFCMLKPVLVLLILLVLTSYQNLVHWLESHLLTCYVKHLTGIDCPGCGLQRSIIALLRGDMAQSWHLYPATIPLLSIWAFTVVHIQLKFSWGATLIKFGYFFIVFIIVLNYILKIKNSQLY